jgi:hypothetical protein
MGENSSLAPVGAPVGGITERKRKSLANLRPPWPKGVSNNRVTRAGMGYKIRLPKTPRALPRVSR